MFIDPQVITINAVPYTLARVESSGKKSVYRANDGNHTLTISHQVSNERIRSMYRLDERVVATNPVSSQTDYETLSSYFVIDRPVYGFSMVDVERNVAGLKNALDTAAIDKMYGLES